VMLGSRESPRQRDCHQQNEHKDDFLHR
jgi:hypothetical protein